MSKFEIEGPNNLRGEIAVFGAKNVALKLIAASVLIPGKVILHNVPDIIDVTNMLEILKKAGAEISQSGHTLEIDTTNLSDSDPDPILMEKLRASVVYIGPYLSRFKKLNIPRPGGCSIGSRSIDVHLDAFRQLGAKVTHKNVTNSDNCIDRLYHISCECFSGQTANLKEASCTATENILMAASLIPGQTIIKNAAKEPQITDLAKFLNRAGANISGAGNSEIIVKGVEKLHGLDFTVMPDPIEAGTFIALGIVTKSLLKVTHCHPEDLQPFLSKLTEIGVKFSTGEEYIQLEKVDELKSVNIETDIFPGFPTDLQAPIGLVLTQTEGTSQIKENLFENRLGYLNELAQMGANIEIQDCHTAKIIGPTKLTGAEIESLDLRAGATVLLAGLAAEGKTTINKAEIIDRGYEKIEERLAKLGAKIKRIQ